MPLLHLEEEGKTQICRLYVRWDKIEDEIASQPLLWQEIMVIYYGCWCANCKIFFSINQGSELFGSTDYAGLMFVRRTVQDIGFLNIQQPGDSFVRFTLC